MVAFVGQAVRRSIRRGGTLVDTFPVCTKPSQCSDPVPRADALEHRGIDETVQEVRRCLPLLLRGVPCELRKEGEKDASES